MLNDRIQVIDWLENILPAVGKMHSPFYSDSEMENLAADALELLKEKLEIVKCKDCKYAITGLTNNEAVVCNCVTSLGRVHFGDWHCAEAERR